MLIRLNDDGTLTVTGGYLPQIVMSAVLDALLSERNARTAEIEQLRADIRSYHGDICPWCSRAKVLPEQATEF